MPNDKLLILFDILIENHIGGFVGCDFIIITTEQNNYFLKDVDDSDMIIIYQAKVEVVNDSVYVLQESEPKKIQLSSPSSIESLIQSIR